MRKQISKRVLSVALTAAMALSILPVSTASAATEVTPSPTQDSSSTLNVEYFTSTLYNWDEDKANAATATADYSTAYTSTTVAYSAVASSDNRNYTSTSYYNLVDGTYYSVYYTRSKSGRDTTYTLYYLNGSTYTQIGSTTNGNDTVTLYTLGGYEGEGFYFTNGNNRQSTPIFSQWLDSAQNYMIYSGLAESNLAESTNAPFDNDNVNAANLFATDGSNTSYTDVYTNVGVPFVYDDSTGYYTLDSDLYAVYFDGGSTAAKSNTNLTIADKPAAHSYTTISGYSYATGFLPFDDVSTNTVNAVESGGTSTSNTGTTAYTTSSTTWGFGMALTVTFTMTEDGKITVTDENGNDVSEEIIFEFSGDDDVWVYVDNTLALDIGGTHDAITGKINFATGNVTLTAGSYGVIGDLTGKTSTSSVTTSSSLSQTNLYTALSTDLKTFAASGTHTLTVYYMERGRGRSNCKIKFNLPQTDTVSVTKQLNTTDSEGRDLSDDELDTEFTFTLYKNGSIVTNTAYIVQEANGVIVESNGNTGEDGTFTLKGGQTAVFTLSLDGNRTYYVVETNPYDESDSNTYYEDPSWSYSSNISAENITYTETSSSKWTSGTAHLTGRLDTAESLSFVCTNTKGYLPTVKVNAVNDVVVIDYNLPVTVDVLNNDEIIGDSPTVEIKTQGSDGTSVVNNDDNSITYTLKNVLSEVDSVKYTLTATDTVDKTTTKSDDATLSVVPASSVYYEDDFATSESDGVVGIAFSDEYSWTTVNGDATSRSDSQSSDNVIYGTDAAYADDTTYSNGTATSAQSGATATFTFIGTGVDIYSSTNSDACIVYVYLYSVTNNGTETMVQYAVSNNYAADGKYYVVPTVTFENLTYGTYKVKLRVVKNSTDNDAVNYYLDGIRVYNPLGTVTNDGSVAGTAYAAANELNAVFTELRSMLIDGSAELQGENDENGVIFIDQMTDGSTGQTTTQISTYENLIAEHEVYLSSGNGIAFTLNNFNEGDAVYVGIKLTGVYGEDATGGSGKVEVTNGDNGKAEIEITSTMDQYYKITPDSSGNVVIMNTSESKAVISLTKVRTTSPDTNDITFVSNGKTVTYALATFRTLTTTAYGNEVLTEEEVTEQTEAETTETVESEDETEAVETETESNASGDVEIENPDSGNGSSSGSGSQSNFSSIFDKIAGWMSGRR